MVNKKKCLRNQIYILVAMALVALDCLVAYKWELISNTKISLMLGVILLNLALIVQFWFHKDEIISDSILVVDYFMNKKTLMLVILLYVVLCIYMYDTIPMFDSSQYFSQISIGIDKINANPLSIIDAYTIIGKQMQLFSILLIPFLVVFDCAPLGIYILNTLLVVIAMICIYSILRLQLNNISDNCCAALAWMYGVFPFIYNGVTYVNPDFYCAVFFPMMVWLYLMEYDVLYLFVASMFCGMKTNMLVSYMVFLLIMEGGRILKREKIIEILKNGKAIIYVLPVILGVWLKYFRTIPAWSGHQNQSNRDLFPLLDVAEARLLQEFVYGFKWLIVLSFVLLVIVKRINIKKIHKVVFAIVSSSIVQLFVYLYLHNTKLSVSPRYWALDAFMYIILLGIVISSLSHENVRKVIIALFVLALTIQQFITIDPVILLTCRSFEFEKERVYAVLPENYIEGTGLGDCTAYNTQYTVWNDIWKEIFLSDIITDDVILYATSDRGHEEIANKYRFGINGFNMMDYYYDTQKRTIVYKKTENAVKFSIENIYTDEDVWNLILKGESKILVMEPDTVQSNVGEILINSNYNIAFEKTYENRYTSLKLRIFELNQ